MSTEAARQGGEAAIICRNFTEIEALERYRDAWNELARHAGEPNVFYESWMLLPALRHLSDSGARFEFVLMFERGAPESLIAFFPLIERSRYKRWPIRYLSMWQYIHCYLCSPLIAKGREHEAAKTFMEWLAAHPAGRLMLWNEIDAAGPFCRALMDICGAEQRDYFRADFERAQLALEHKDAESHARATLSKNLQKEMRRKRNRLEEQGALSFEFGARNGDIAGWIAEFAALEASGWKGREGSSLNASESNFAFVRSALTEGYAQGQLLLSSLRLSGKLIAACCNLRSGSAGYAFKIAYDENFGKFSPGVLLALEDLKQFYAAQGLMLLDSCAAENNEMANRLWTAKRSIASLAVAGRSGPAGLLLRFYAPFLARARSPACLSRLAKNLPRAR